MGYSRRDYLRRSSTAAVTGITGISLLSERTTGDDEDLASVLDDRVPTLLNRYDVPGVAVAVITRGEVSWANAYGDTDRETNRPMTQDTLCRPQSITK